MANWVDYLTRNVWPQRYWPYDYWPEAPASVPYRVEVDWGNDGAWTGADDITADVAEVEIDHGFPDALSRVARVGRCTITVRNDHRRYAPRREANARPRRPVRVRMQYGGTTATLFRGFLEDIEPDAGDAAPPQLARLVCVDAIGLLQLHELALGLQLDQRGDQIISAIVADCYTPPATAYDVDIDTFPFAADRWTDDIVYEGNRQRALQAIRDVCLSDWGWFYIQRDGTATFENRHHRLLDQTPVATLDNAMAAMRYAMRAESIFNRVEVTPHPRKVGGANEVLWSLNTDRTPKVEPGVTRTYRAVFVDPAEPEFRIGGKDVVAPVGTTDYTMNDTDGGGGADLTGSFAVVATVYANSADLAVTNNGSVAGYITKLQVRGLAVRVYEPPVLVAEDAASQTAYQKRALAVNAVLQDDVNAAEDQANYILGLYVAPVDEIRGVRWRANRDATHMALARDLQIGDRVTLVEDETGINGDFFVHALRHRIRGGGSFHDVELDVEQADAVSYWLMDVSQLDVDTRLAY